jgi:EAL domain-containing protein (putative c-di-GMP-specific phosphodiesterase class I)
LRDFPVDKLKIDQTFVRNMVLDSSDASLIRAMIEVARSLDLDVVAEGIETSTQCAFLVQHGCATGQGYLYSMPLDAEDFGWILAQDRPLPGIGRPEFPGLGAVPLAARAVNG